MRSEKEVYDIVLNFAKTDKRIRMVTLEGSRTNTKQLFGEPRHCSVEK